MIRLKINLVLVFFLLLAYFLQSEAQHTQQNSEIKTVSDGEKLLDCSELTDLTAISLCLARRFTELKKKSPSRSYGYPHQIAPTLPPFLISDPPANNIATFPKRRIDSFEIEHQARIQGYSEPQYRNFLDLDSTLRPRITEYRPIFDGYAVPVLVHSAQDNPYRRSSKEDYYSKPVKTDGLSRRYSRKQRKGYGQRLPNPPTRYSTRDQQDYNDGHKKSYVKDNYNTAYSRESHHSKSNSYDRDYYVPANSPIIGDIRRSLLDYTGAADLMVDEPEYVIRSHRIKEMGNDYYPFRRSYVRDLEVNESKERKTNT